MKKLFAFTLSAAIAVSACAFGGCSSGDIGVIDGNYSEANAVQLEEALAKIDTNNPFVETTDKENCYGFKFNAAFNGSYEMNQLMSTSFSTVVDYKLSLDSSGAYPDLAGSGKLTSDNKSTLTVGGTSVTQESKYDVSVYNDYDYVYLNVTAGEVGKFKISFYDLINGMLVGYNEDIDENLPEEGDTETPPEDLTIAGILDKLETAGVKTYLDTSDGVKVKISITQDSVDKLIDEVIDSMEGEITEESSTEIKALLSSLKFNSMKFDIYLAFSSEGKFLKFGTDMDIDFSLDASSLSPSESISIGEMRIVLKGGMMIEMFNRIVTIPEGIADDPSYIEMNGI